MADTLPDNPTLKKEPQLLGPYELQERLGRGGMAEAYVAVKPGPGGFRMPVCVKVILPESVGEPGFIDGFLDEASIHAHLSHPNIVKVLDFGLEPGVGGRYYLVLELIQGVDLRKLAYALERQNRRLPPHMVAGIGFLLASALKCAHGLVIDGVHQNLVHRDISPANVLLSLFGDVKLSDFGVVKAKSRITRTETGFAKGKGRYMAPEQILSGQLDGRADLFSLGVVLFELYAGRNPFRLRDDDAEIAMAQRVVANQRPKLIEVAPHVPDSHCAVVEQLLEHSADNRVQNASQAMTLLAPLISDPTWTSELGDYVRAARDGTPFPDSALHVRPSSGGAKPSEVVTATRTDIVRKERTDLPGSGSVPPSGPVATAAKVDTARPANLKRWARWLVPLAAALVAGAIALTSGTKEAPAVPAAQSVANAPAAAAPVAPAQAPAEPASDEPARKASVNPGTAENLPSITAGGDSANAQPAGALLNEPVDATDSLPPAATSPAGSIRRSTNGSTSPSGADSLGRVEPPERHSSSRQSASTTKQAGTLRIVVVPFGDIEVDGRRMTTPVMELAPGVHHIHAGRTAALLHRRSVRLKPGEYKEIIIELADNE